MSKRHLKNALIQQAARLGQACRNCLHLAGQRLSRRRPSCRLRRSPHTENGYGPTKLFDWCEQWTPREDNPSAD